MSGTALISVSDKSGLDRLGPALIGHGWTLLSTGGTARTLREAGCEVLDVRGMRVYPGLVAVNSSGILGREPPENTTDLFSLNLVLALAGGITTAVTGGTAAKLTYGTTEGMVVKRNLFLTLSYSRRYPERRRKLRAELTRVRRYLRDLEAYEAARSSGKKDAKEPDKGWLKGNYADYLKLLQGTRTARLVANTVQEIRDACGLAAQFGFPLVIDGGREAWIVADEIARAGAKLIITPRRKAYRDRSRNAPSGWTIENARILHDHGVCFAVLPAGRGISLGGITGRDLMALPMEAAFAVRGGLSDEDALRAVTVDAARVLGLEHRIGSIEKGKDGDFVVCRGELLHYETLVEYTVVNGRVVWATHPELALVAVWHRHGLNDNRFTALIEGTGLRKGALATTYAHDSHNLVVIGRNPTDMAVAVNALTEAGGGYVAVAGGEVRALASLPVAGLLAQRPVPDLARDFALFIDAARALGVVEQPMGLLASLPLPVVPRFRPTDMGLVDVARQVIVSAWGE